MVTPIDGVYDVPSRVDEQLAWLLAAGLEPAVTCSHRDLAVLIADRLPAGRFRAEIGARVGGSQM